jgi:hypothetical protein
MSRQTITLTCYTDDNRVRDAQRQLGQDQAQVGRHDGKGVHGRLPGDGAARRAGPANAAEVARTR